MTVTSVIKIADTAIRRRAPRLAGDTRRAQIIEAACQFFAQHGFSGPTRDLAASIGVTQALLYRYFDSKTDLIDAVFTTVFRGHWSDDGLAIFDASEGRPMAERIAGVYAVVLPRMSGTATRLFFRAGLDAYAGPISRCVELGWPIWSAMIDAWRREEGLPSLAQRPMLEGERSAVSAFHEAMLMIRVREHILHTVRSLDEADEIREVAEIYDAGVRAVIRRLHAGEASAARCAVATCGDDSQVAA